jgi:16S rRNA (uracil1498-N3)-methyltransferase
MSLPLFYVADLSQNSIVLNEDTSKHVIGVLRMSAGETITLTNGKGKKATAIIEDDNRKKCRVSISSIQVQEISPFNSTIGISLIKNTARFEWFLEKATEIGIRRIIPLLCERTEKQKFRLDRMQTILTSAMIQSQQSWLPELNEPVTFSEALQQENQYKFIAHCMEAEKSPLPRTSSGSSVILIGPEGDFTPKEIQSALDHQFKPVSLGHNRLRTETAGVVAAILLSFG